MWRGQEEQSGPEMGQMPAPSHHLHHLGGWGVICPSETDSRGLSATADRCLDVAGIVGTSKVGSSEPNWDNC